MEALYTKFAVHGLISTSETGRSPGRLFNFKYHFDKVSSCDKAAQFITNLLGPKLVEASCLITDKVDEIRDVVTYISRESYFDICSAKHLPNLDPIKYASPYFVTLHLDNIDECHKHLRDLLLRKIHIKKVVCVINSTQQKYIKMIGNDLEIPIVSIIDQAVLEEKYLPQMHAIINEMCDIAHAKKTRAVLAIDSTDSGAVYNILNEIGNLFVAVMLKPALFTLAHESFTNKLLTLKATHNFKIIIDAKLADQGEHIASTIISSRMRGGWSCADAVTIHGIMDDVNVIVQHLHKNNLTNKCGLIIVACDGIFMDERYLAKMLSISKNNRQSVIGLTVKDSITDIFSVNVHGFASFLRHPRTDIDSMNMSGTNIPQFVIVGNEILSHPLGNIREESVKLLATIEPTINHNKAPNAPSL